MLKKFTLEKVFQGITLSMMEKNSKVILFINQNQTLMPELSFSLRVLEMNNTDLNELIEQEAVENPFLICESSKKDYNSFGTNQIVDKLDFRQEIFRQLAFYSMTEDEKNVATILIYNITNEGYLDHDVINQLRESYSYSFCVSVINRLKQTEYGHYFSFNFQDKMKNILQKLGQYTRAHEQMLMRILKEGRICNYKNENYQRVKNDIKNALRFISPQSTSENLILPVDLIAQHDTDSMKVEVEDNISEVKIDNDLYNEMKIKIRTNIEKKYIEEKNKSVKLLLKAVCYRNSTLLRVAKEILYHQSGFFYTNSDLVPLSASTIASNLDIHESTVHRAVANKTIATPCGTFELKKLLAKRVNISDWNEKVSDFSVKQYIKQLINQEPPHSPYSDENIVYFLSTRGIVISRRTVAKYRKSMNFPNSIHRLKNYKITEYK